MSDSTCRKRLQLGGQAVIEGVMMRSPTCIATAVRTRNGIVVKRESYVSLVKSHRVLNIPVLRGAVAFVETLAIAISSLSYSAQMAEADSAVDSKSGSLEGGQESGKDAALSGKDIDAKRVSSSPIEDGVGREPSRSSKLSVAAVIVVAFALGFGLFFYLPLLLTELTGLEHGVLFNLVDGAIRLAVMVLYIVIVTRWKEMRRIFEYHGAEHKAIAAFECEGKATVENARSYSTVHARCSTSFLLLVVVVSVVVFIILGRPDSLREKLIRFAFIPVIGGIAYEILKLSAHPRFRRWFAPILWPGFALQRLTTAEPADDQVEVAIAALDACTGEKPVES